MGMEIAKAYQLLGVAIGADELTVTASYRKLSYDMHPDRGGDAEKFKELSEAYSVVKSAIKHGVSTLDDITPNATHRVNVTPYEILRRIMGGGNPEIDAMMNGFMDRFMEDDDVF